MGALPNPKHERFAQFLAKGLTASEAYTRAGYSFNDGNAIRLKGNERVSDRVAEIQERAALRTEVTVAGITERLLNLAAVAEKTGISTDDENGAVSGSSPRHLSVARAALMDAAKLNGLIVERAEHSGPDGGPIQTATAVDLSNLTPDQLRALASIKLPADS